MTTIDDIAQFLESFAPERLAEAWDNVGLLVGDRRRGAERVMTCLTVTPTSAAEAIERRADLVVAHHPLPFQPLRRLTTDTTEGRLLLDLIAAGVAIYSPHTAFDSAHSGINARLAEAVGLTGIEPLVPAVEGELGAGRRGRPGKPTTLDELTERARKFLKIERVQVVGESNAPLQSVAVACGSAGELVEAAITADCDCLVTGEARFHACLAAEASGMGLVLVGHFASERFGVEALSDVLAKSFPALEIWPSARERDPIRWL